MNINKTNNHLSSLNTKRGTVASAIGNSGHGLRHEHTIAGLKPWVSVCIAEMLYVFLNTNIDKVVL